MSKVKLGDEVLLNRKKFVVVQIDKDYKEELTLLSPITGEEEFVFAGAELKPTGARWGYSSSKQRRPYTFRMFHDGGNRKMLTAGCRAFHNLKDARAHWNDSPKAWGYLEGEEGWDQRIDKNNLSLKIIDKLEKRLEK